MADHSVDAQEVFQFGLVELFWQYFPWQGLLCRRSNNFWLNFIFLFLFLTKFYFLIILDFKLTTIPVHTSTPLIYYPLFQWRFGNPFIRWSHTFTPEMPQRLLDISTALNVFFLQTVYVYLAVGIQPWVTSRLFEWSWCTYHPPYSLY